MSLPSLPALLLISAALVLAGCGDDGTPATTPTVGDNPTAAGATATTAATGGSETDLKAKPAVRVPSGRPPSRLVTDNLVKGDGRTAKAGDTVTVQYVGVDYSSGQEFDASWDRGEPFTFRLGAGQVIQGWDEGIPGMKVGGRRKLVIPSDLAYGSAGAPPAIGPDAALVFDVDLLKVER